MSQPESNAKTRAADLSELITRFNRGDLTITDVVTLAYGMGHGDAMAAFERSNAFVAKALGVKEGT